MTDQPNVAADIAEALATESPQATALQTRVRRGGAAARAAVLELATAPAGSKPQRIRLRAAVLAADACADDSVLRALLTDAGEDPSSPLLSDLLTEVGVMARADGPAATLLADAAVTADLLAAAIEARPDDPRIADAVLEALGDSSGFRMAPRPVRSRENAAKVTRNGIVLLERSTDDIVRHRLEQVLLARLTPAGSASNDEVLHAVLASPSGRGPELLEDLARAGAPGIQRQAARVLGRPVEEAALPAPVAGETIAIPRGDVGRWTRAEDAETLDGSEQEPEPESAERAPRRRRWWTRYFRPKR
ncbi:hypothetical protein [Planctomonas psychrotolerans]|uniref:hypothetical protein n=1 Tax=Planctomonas psychrotolerans TaxID=2528712 RepID=UPI00123C06E7|nr:hypothetical protein [Planctomonas psychrotolerans]